MKFKTTKKEINSNYNTIISIGYCNAHNLLYYTDPIAYSTRAEGWACDYYDINGVIVSTGYAPIAPKNSKRDYDLTRRYDDQAQKIIYNHQLPIDERKAQVTALLNEYIKEATKND